MKGSFVSWWDASYYAVMDTVVGVKPADLASVEALSLEPELEAVSQYIDRLDGYTNKLIVSAESKLRQVI